MRNKFQNSFSPASVKGKEINQIIADENFLNTLSQEEAELWISFSNVVQGFLGKNRDANYMQHITHLNQMCEKYQLLMSLKMHILFQHSDKFSESNSDFSDENGERLHQLLKPCLKRNQSNTLIKTVADYIWRIDK